MNSKKNMRNLKKFFIRKAISSAIFLVGLSLVFLMCVHLFQQYQKNSDDANAMLAGYSMLHGNWRLAGWRLAPDSFWTADLPLYALLLRIIGFRPRILIYVPALLWSLVVVLSAVLSMSNISGNSVKAFSERVWSVVPLAALAAFPIIGANPALASITHIGSHAGSISYALAILLLAQNTLNPRKHLIWWSVGLFIVSLLGTAGDPLVLVIGVVPAVLAAFVSNHDPAQRRLWVAATTVVGGLLGHELVELNSAFGGFAMASMPMAFTSFQELPKNAVLTVQGLLMLFDAYFFSKPLAAALLQIIRLPLPLIVLERSSQIVSIMKCKLLGLHVPEINYLDAALGGAIVINIAAALFSTLLVDISSSRYFIPVLVFGAVLIGRTTTQSLWLKLLYAIILTTSILAFAAEIAVSVTHSVALPSELRPLVKGIKKLDIRRGYGPYWSASIVTVMTRNRIKVRALASDGRSRLVPYEWFAQRSWYSAHLAKRRPFFIISEVGTEAAPPFTHKQVLRQFGEPCISRRIDDYVIDVYEPKKPTTICQSGLRAGTHNQ